jgi:hypothetical protein
VSAPGPAVDDDKEDNSMLRRGAAVAAGLVMAASLGLTGAGMASAAAPALKIHNGSLWTQVVSGAGCEVLTFHSNFTFATTEFGGDAGKWKGGGATIKMKWTAGSDIGLTFQGTFTTTPVKEYSGMVNNGNAPGQLVKGAVPGC